MTFSGLSASEGKHKHKSHKPQTLLYKYSVLITKSKNLKILNGRLQIIATIAAKTNSVIISIIIMGNW